MTHTKTNVKSFDVMIHCHWLISSVNKLAMARQQPIISQSAHNIMVAKMYSFTIMELLIACLLLLHHGLTDATSILIKRSRDLAKAKNTPNPTDLFDVTSNPAPALSFMHISTMSPSANPSTHPLSPSSPQIAAAHQLESTSQTQHGENLSSMGQSAYTTGSKFHTLQPTIRLEVSSIQSDSTQAMPTLKPTFLIPQTPSISPTANDPSVPKGFDQTSAYNGNLENPSAPGYDIQSLEFYRNQLFSPICSVFFPSEAILDGRQATSFEAAAKNFIVKNIDDINLPVIILNVRDVTIVSQVLAWKRPSRRLGEGIAGGLDVYIRVDILATGYATRDELEISFQELLDSSNNVFSGLMNLTTKEEIVLDATQLTLVVVAGCSGFVAMMFAISMFILKEKRRYTHQSNPQPVVPPSAKRQPKEKYPLQESRQGAQHYVSLSMYFIFVSIFI